MNVRLLALALAVCGAARAAVISRDAPDRWKAVADRLYATVVQVRGIEAQETVTRGTGVLIGNGLAVTTLHSVAVPVAGNLRVVGEVLVLTPTAGTLRAQVIEAMPELDLALLLLGGKGAALSGAILATEPAAIGDRLVAMGSSEDEIAGIGVVVSEIEGDLLGLVSRRMLDSRFWGGPLFDANGRLAGVQLASAAGAKAIAAHVIQELLDRRAAREPAGTQ